MTLVAFLALFVASVVVHELGHAVAGWASGRDVKRPVWKWYGVGVPVEVGNPRTLWKVALAGPLANAVVAVLIFPFADTPLGWAILAINVDLALINLLPLRFCDGGQIIKSLRSQPA